MKTAEQYHWLTKHRDLTPREAVQQMLNDSGASLDAGLFMSLASDAARIMRLTLEDEGEGTSPTCKELVAAENVMCEALFEFYE